MAACTTCQGSGYVSWVKAHPEATGTRGKILKAVPHPRPDDDKMLPKGVGLCVQCLGSGEASTGR